MKNIFVLFSLLFVNILFSQPKYKIKNSFNLIEPELVIYTTNDTSIILKDTGIIVFIQTSNSFEIDRVFKFENGVPIRIYPEYIYYYTINRQRTGIYKRGF